MDSAPPELSVIIPTYNEASRLPALLISLVKQTSIDIEIIIVDGGSQDQTCQVMESCLALYNIPYRIVISQLGRAHQMNAGAGQARGLDLLFLHADSYLHDDKLLYDAKQSIDRIRCLAHNDNIAGHFGICFETTLPKSNVYRFFETKSRLNRANCINGDQGFWLSKVFFSGLGGFDTSLAYMEDARLSKLIFQKGQWATLPGVLQTSARRFESEGLKQRQILNALLCNFEFIQLTEFFDCAVNAYNEQDNRAGQLDLLPFFQIIHQVSLQKGYRKFFSHWYQTGHYVANNIWQVAFFIDWWWQIRKMETPIDYEHKVTQFYDKWLGKWVSSVIGRFLMMMMTFIWFYCHFIAMQCRRWINQRLA